MEPGPELDKKVCDAVGIEPYEVYAPVDSFEECVLEYPSVSTDIGAAWQIVRVMEEKYGFERGNGFMLNREKGVFNDLWYCEFSSPAWEEAQAETPEMAICLAALKAVENG